MFCLVFTRLVLSQLYPSCPVQLSSCFVFCLVFLLFLARALPCRSYLFSPCLATSCLLMCWLSCSFGSCLTLAGRALPLFFSVLSRLVGSSPGLSEHVSPCLVLPDWLDLSCRFSLGLSCLTSNFFSRFLVLRFASYRSCCLFVSFLVCLG